MRAVTATFFRPDCLHFRGDVPCKPHKSHGYHCDSCPAYVRTGKRILIIKLGAMGDVIRTTPLVSRYSELYPDARFTWVTLYPDILPKDRIHEVLPLGVETVLYVSNSDWDIAINLDKEKAACALLKMVSAREKYGYILRDGVAQPVNDLAHHKFRTGLFDDDSRRNTQSYCSEIFGICGLEYRGESYLLDRQAWQGYDWDIPRDKPVIGLNTGCGDRWPTRLWSVERWVELVQRCASAGLHPLLLGGASEHERNLAIQARSGASYPGHYPLAQFISLLDQCDLLVTQVTMSLHLGLGLGKKIVLMNNIFNPHEFDLFGRGTIVMPPRSCDCYYRGQCIHGTSCMESLGAETVFDCVMVLLTTVQPTD
ncbi:MAG: glycosyltransferase family 9 protein [Gammaproteobacteria bacterium]